MYLKNYVNKLPVEFEFTWIQILEVISTTECDLFLHLCVVLFVAAEKRQLVKVFIAIFRDYLMVMR